MNDETTCPICRLLCGEWQTQRTSHGFYCQACGRFEVSGSAFASYGKGGVLELPALQRAILSHKLNHAPRADKPPMVTTVVIESLRDERLPVRSIQAAHLIRVIGDTCSAGDIFAVQDSLPAKIGALNNRTVRQLANEMAEGGLLHNLPAVSASDFYGGEVGTIGWDLTLKGWEIYERDQRSGASGSFAFLAMKYGDAALEAFARDVIKPAVGSTGFDLVDMRDVARAGVIDNLLREQIRDAPFVLVDLTHDNYGAYWEAGYAEGLGKPVIYLCEQNKFGALQTHFDTNHSTTVLWSAADPDAFTKQLQATIRRSLNLFPDRESRG